jgi:hypothetical protein
LTHSVALGAMMRMVTRVGWALGLVLGLVGSAPLWADAASDFKLGQQYQAAKQWGAAVKAYSQALKDDPNATYAYKALGTVYYMAGDKRGALAYYRRYLATHPQDAATRRFADQLAAALGQPAVAASNAPAPAAAASGPHGGLSLRVEGGAVMDSPADVLKFYPSNSQPAGSGGMAPAVGIAADYALEGGFVLGLDLIDGPNRTDKVTWGGSGTTYTDTFKFSNFCIGVTPGWRFRLGHAWLLEGRLGIGYLSSTLNISTTFDNQTVSGTSSGFDVWPQLRGEYAFGHWGIGASLGYLYANATPVKAVSGGVSYTMQTSDGSNWTESNGGPSFALYAAYHFHSPF